MAKYLHGLPHFIVEMHHKPLVPILNDRSLIEMSPRIQRLRMKLLQFRLTAQYICGCDNVDADAFSRAAVTDPTASNDLAETGITMHVNSVVKQLPATDQRLEQILKLSTTDETLLLLKETILNGWRNKIQQCPLKLQPYWNYRNDITEVEGLLLYRSRIIIPSELRKDILERIHSGHLAMDKCKRRLTDSVFWPGLTNQIEQKVCTIEAKRVNTKPNCSNATMAKNRVGHCEIRRERLHLLSRLLFTMAGCILVKPS